MNYRHISQGLVMLALGMIGFAGYVWGRYDQEREIRTNAPTTQIVTVPKINSWTEPDTAEPRDAPPRRVLIGPYVYTIHYRAAKSLPDAFAETNINSHEILLQDDMEPGMFRETLLHEIFHGAIALGSVRGLSDKPVDEDEFIEASAPTIVMVLRDNPELVRWLARRVR